MIITKLVVQKIESFQVELLNLVRHAQNQLNRPGMSQKAIYEYQHMINEAQNLDMWAAVRKNQIPRTLGEDEFLVLTREVSMMNLRYTLGENEYIKGRTNQAFSNKTALLLDALRSCVG